MKQCPKCKVEKEVTKENWYLITDTCKEGRQHPHRVGRPKGKCLECRKKASDSYNKLERVREGRAQDREAESYKLKNNVRVKLKTARTKLQAIEYKGGKCEHCGYDKCAAAMDFHHLDPDQKDFSLSQYRTRSFEDIKPELDKCILLCSNCHRELHAEESKQILEEQLQELSHSYDIESSFFRLGGDVPVRLRRRKR